nr:hypothetical protein [Tanacetum cinerariifolium]
LIVSSCLNCGGMGKASKTSVYKGGGGNGKSCKPTRFSKRLHGDSIKDKSVNDETTKHEVVMTESNLSTTYDNDVSLLKGGIGEYGIATHAGNFTNEPTVGMYTFTGLNVFTGLNALTWTEITSNATLSMSFIPTGHVKEGIGVGIIIKRASGTLHSQVPNANTIAAIFGVPLKSIEDIDVLTRKIEVGDYEDVMTGMTIIERKAAMDAIEAVWKKLLADVAGTSNESKGVSTDLPTIKSTSPSIDTPIVKSYSFTKPVSYDGAAGASSSKPCIGEANFCHLEVDNVFDGVRLSILMNVFQTVTNRFENTLYGYFIGKQIAFP